LLTGLPQSLVEFCMRRLSSKGMLQNSGLSAISHNNAGLPSEFRVPYSAALSTICIQLLQKSESIGCVDEALFVWDLLKSGQTFEAVSCNIAHLMTSSIIAAHSGKLWTVTPTHEKSYVAMAVNAVNLPPLKQCVFIEFDDSILPSLSVSSSVTAALPISAIRFEELLSEAAQALLQQSSIDLSSLANSMKETHGSLPRSIFSIFSGKSTLQDASFLDTSSRNCAHNHRAQSDDAASRTCYLCLLSGDDNPVTFSNSCGHGLCGDCWKSLVSAAIVSSSTPAVKSGEDVSGAVTVLSMKCSADPENKCKAKIDFGVLCQAVPNMVKPFIRSTMSNLSRLLLSGGAGTCQCECGAVVSGVCLLFRFQIIYLSDSDALRSS
jgi:hypothetical protein